MRSMTGLELGWVAGLIEGEGYLGAVGGRPHIQVDSTDEDIVRRLFEWTGVGSLYGPWMGTNKLVWRWRVERRDDAGALLELLLPVFGQRRGAKARVLVDAWKALPAKRGTASTCSYGHELTPENTRLADGRRRCRKCCARRTRESRERKRLAALAA